MPFRWQLPAAPAEAVWLNAVEFWLPLLATTPPETPLLPAVPWLKLRDWPVLPEEAGATVTVWPVVGLKPGSFLAEPPSEQSLGAGH